MYSSMLIGRFAEVVQSLDHGLLGRSGLIIDETKNMIHLRVESGEMIKVPKSVVTLKLGRSRDQMIIDGMKLMGTAVDRIRG